MEEIVIVIGVNKERWQLWNDGQKMMHVVLGEAVAVELVTGRIKNAKKKWKGW